MNILFLNAYFMPENIAFTHLEKDLLDTIVDCGHRIDVICPVPTRGINKEVARQYKGIKFEELYGGRVRVHRFWAPQEGTNPFVRMLRYFWCNFRQYCIGQRFKDTDVIFAYSTPPTQGFLASALKRKLGCRFVYSLQDIFPDSLVTSGMARTGSVLWKIGRWIEDRTYQGADKIVVISEDFRKNILGKGVSGEKVEVIYNWVDTGVVEPIPRERNILFDRYHLDRSKFYVCYSGNIGHSQNMDLLLEVAKRLSREQPDIQFVIIGDGAARERVERRVQDEGIPNVILLPFQPYEEISHVFSLGDAGLIISKRGIGESSVPSKAWSIMAAGRPVLASFDLESELCDVVRRVDCGLCVQAGDEDVLRQAILKLYKNRACLERMGENGRKLGLRELTKDGGAEKYEKLMRGLAVGRGGGLER